MTLEAGAMDTLGKVAGGDMRKAITTVQSAVRLRVNLSSPHRTRHSKNSLLSGPSRG